MRCILVLALICSTAPPLSATTYTITTTADDGVGCTLRLALEAAASDLPAGECPAGTAEDLIQLASEGAYAFFGGQVLLEGEDVEITVKGLSGNPHLHLIGLADHRFAEVAAGAFLTLEAVTISGGDATGGVPGGGGGGALLVRDGASLAVLDSVFYLNIGRTRGGAVHFVSGTSPDAVGSLEIRDTVFESNFAVGSEHALGADGGAVYATAYGLVEIADCVFWNNTAVNVSHPPTSLNWALGGAVSIRALGEASVSVVRSSYVGNRALGQARASGAGLHLIGYGSSSVVATDLRFEGNEVGSIAAHEAELGGAAAEVVAFPGSILLDRVIADGNGTDGDEGESFARQIGLAAHDGGILTARNAVVVRGPDDGVRALAASGGDVRMANLTIAHNASTGLFAQRNSGSTMSFGNTILWGNGSDFETFALPPSQTANSIGQDPHFIDPANGNYWIHPETSPAVDAGSAAALGIGTTDVTGGPRIWGPAPDQGAFEAGLILFLDGFESGGVGAWSSSSR